ncbi:hypothetical protein [Dickeya chrysanthemi]|uniref:hypothetical protein n=1 Tax=Dickeya chrysanthemi TaxID=556 RepID=UPI001378DF39|nr:hypothetical protein [Dickeya chrysanthemi]MBX9444252.1 hypothetical protein [Dickeya chrysanthemi]
MSNTGVTRHDFQHDGVTPVQPTRRPGCATTVYDFIGDKENRSRTQAKHFSVLKVDV